MVVAEFTITPVVGGELRPFIDAVVDVVKKSGLKYEVDAMGTTIEGNIDDILNVVKLAHQTVKAMGVNRVMTEIRIDDKASGITMDEEVMEYRSSI